jgi:excisionase family DNA binding protein
MIEPRQAYSVDEVRRRVGIGRASIFKAIKDGHLRIAKCGRRTLILTDDLAVWLDSMRQTEKEFHVVTPRKKSRSLP